MMKSIQVNEFGDVDVLKYTDVCRPQLTNNNQVYHVYVVYVILWAKFPLYLHLLFTCKHDILLSVLHCLPPPSVSACLFVLDRHVLSNKIAHSRRNIGY